MSSCRLSWVFIVRFGRSPWKIHWISRNSLNFSLFIDFLIQIHRVFRCSLNFTASSKQTNSSESCSIYAKFLKVLWFSGISQYARHFSKCLEFFKIHWIFQSSVHFLNFMNFPDAHELLENYWNFPKIPHNSPSSLKLFQLFKLSGASKLLLHLTSTTKSLLLMQLYCIFCLLNLLLFEKLCNHFSVRLCVWTGDFRSFHSILSRLKWKCIAIGYDSLVFFYLFCHATSPLRRACAYGIKTYTTHEYMMIRYVHYPYSIKYSE